MRVTPTLIDSRRIVRRLVPPVAILSLALALGACGSAQPTETVTVTTSAAPAEPAATTEAPPPRKRKRKRHESASEFVACDANIFAKAGTTSCPFAQNVFYEFWTAQQRGEDAVMAYSPVTRRRYDLTCSTQTKVVCRAPDGSEVRFAAAAIDAYNEREAEAYRCTADLGRDADVTGCAGGDSPTPPDSYSDDAEADDSGCDPNYEGACLDPNSYDYDCEGGSGDGPDYTGPVEVVGDDHYGLDRDGDGYACDW